MDTTMVQGEDPLASTQAATESKFCIPSHANVTSAKWENAAEFRVVLYGLSKTMSVKMDVAHARCNTEGQTTTRSRCWVLNCSSVIFFFFSHFINE